MKIIPIGEAAPDAEVVERCRDLLTKAERGELRSIMWIAELPNGDRASGYSSSRALFALLGEAARLVHRINRRMDEA